MRQVVVNPWGALLFLLPMGLLVIRFARSSYSYPEATINNWYWYFLPAKAPWAWTLLRGMAVIWIWGGFAMIWGGIAGLFPILQGSASRRSIPLIAALVSTAALVRLTPRRRNLQSARKSQ